MKPVLFSAPRTRSSILYDLLKPWATKKLGMGVMANNSELFLTSLYGKNLSPVIKSDGLYMENSGYMSIFDRIELLHRGDYFVKLNLEIYDKYKAVVDSFTDEYLFVITDRINRIDMILSFLFARKHGVFNIRNSTKHLENLLSVPVYIDVDEVIQYKKYVSRFDEICKYIKNRNHVVFYYEDMDTEKNTENLLDSVFGNEWKLYINDHDRRKAPQHVEKNFSDLIINYEEIKCLLL